MVSLVEHEIFYNLRACLLVQADKLWHNYYLHVMSVNFQTMNFLIGFKFLDFQTVPLLPKERKKKKE